MTEEEIRHKAWSFYRSLPYVIYEESERERCLMFYEKGYTEQLTEKDKQIEELEARIEKIKLQYDYGFSQLCEAREILCLILSQSRDKKEIDYFTIKRGEKLLKEGVFKI